MGWKKLNARGGLNLVEKKKNFIKIDVHVNVSTMFHA